MRQDGRRRTAGPAVGLCEITAESRTNPEQREVRPRDDPSSDSFGDFAVAERCFFVGKAGDPFESRLLRLERLVVHDREAESVRRRVRIDTNEPLGVVVRKRPEERGVDGAEDGGRRADAQTDRRDDRQGHHRRSQQAAKRDAEILDQVVEHQASSHAPLLLLILLTAVLASPLEIAELPACLAPGIGGRQSALLQLLHPHFEVKLQFLVDVGRYGFGPASQIPEWAARGHRCSP